MPHNSTCTIYPVTTPHFTVTTATFSSVDMSIPTSPSNPGYIYTPTYLPTAPGTLTGCALYRNYTGPTALIFDTTIFNTTLDFDYTLFNLCSMVAMINRVTVNQLIKWNPSLSNDTSTCALQPGYSYCVLESTDSSKSQSLVDILLS